MNFGQSPRMIDVTFPALPLGSNRAQQLADNGAKYNSARQTVHCLHLFLVDAFLADIIDRIPSSKYTLIYVTSPREFVENGESDSVVYNSDVFQEPLHMQLKRDYAGDARQDDSDSGKSLFQEYQFLSPGTFSTIALDVLYPVNDLSGIFMGLFASFVCLIILYVGFSALTSLEVPYAAFEKDTAPASQKKQQ